MALWSDFESETLNGYKLTRLARSEGRVAWFQAVSASGEQATITITETLNDEAELLERLRALAEVTNPHLMGLREVNPATLLDTPLVYAIMEPAGESLGDILRSRGLDADETREVLEAVLQGVAALHARGFAHGRIEGDSVIAVGEQIKLRMDCAHRLTPGAAFENAAAQDVRQIGELVARSLTRRRIAGENDPAIQLLPAPFSAVVRRAISGHGTVGELATLAGLPSPYAAFAARPNAVPVPISTAGAKAGPPAGPTPAAPAPKPTGVPAKTEAPAKVQGPVAAQTAAPAVAQTPAGPATNTAPTVGPVLGPTVNDVFAAVKPIAGVAPAAASVAAAGGQPLSTRAGMSPRAEADSAQSSLLFDDDEPKRAGIFQRKSAPYVIGAAAVLILLVLLLFHSLGGHKKPVATAAAPVPANIPAQDLPRPQAAHPIEPASRAAEVAAAPAAAIVPGWRVIAYTYDRRPEAEHKVSQIATKHPQLHPEVFAPHAGHGPYLVELGGPMSREQAARLQQLARKMGEPRDTYIRNYK